MKAIALASIVSCLVVACATGTYAPDQTSSSHHSDGGIISKGDSGTSLPKNDGGTNNPGDDGGSTNTCSGTLCGVDCVDTSSDPLNCGACGNACDVSSTCTGGQCVPSTQGGGEPPQGTCSHSLCSTGSPLELDCDPTSCTDILCDPDFGVDPVCCDTSWDGICVQEVTDYCAPYSCN